MGIVERYLSKEVEQKEWNNKIMGVAERYLNKEVKQEEWSKSSRRNRASQARGIEQVEQEERGNKLSKKSGVTSQARGATSRAKGVEQ
jgi:hypothetical protein